MVCHHAVVSPHLQDINRQEVSHKTFTHRAQAMPMPRDDRLQQEYVSFCSLQCPMLAVWTAPADMLVFIEACQDPAQAMPMPRDDRLRQE